MIVTKIIMSTSNGPSLLLIMTGLLVSAAAAFVVPVRQAGSSFTQYGEFPVLVCYGNAQRVSVYTRTRE